MNERFEVQLSHLDHIVQVTNHSVVQLEAVVAALRESVSVSAAAIDLLSGEIKEFKNSTTEVASREAVDGARLQAEVEDLGRAVVALGSASIGHRFIESEGPLVSIVAPAINDETEIRALLDMLDQQTYQHWECLVAVGGSHERSDVSSTAGLGQRVVRIPIDGHLSSSALTEALERSTGELVALVGPAERWTVDRLSRLVKQLATSDSSDWALDRRFPAVAAKPPLRFTDFGGVICRRGAIARTRSPEGPAWGFGELDVVGSLNRQGDPVFCNFVGRWADSEPNGRLTELDSTGPVIHQIWRRSIGKPARDLRILFAEWHYPQISETYIESDVVGLRALGAEVEVWSDEDVAVPYDPLVKVHRGRLDNAIASFRPHLVVSHWLHTGQELREVSRRWSLPHAVRCHGFDYNPVVLAALLDDPGVHVHMFKHLAGGFARHSRLTIDNVGFDPDRYAPAATKDRTRVVRLAAGLHTKDLETFILAAKLCPEFRFTLGLSHTYGVESRTEEIIDLVKQLDARVEIMIDLGHAEAANLVAESGIYVHTHGAGQPFGMSISIAEAMATGSLVLARDLPGMREYVGEGAILYDARSTEMRAEQIAHIVNSTRSWSDELWVERTRAAIAKAWAHHPADVVAAGMLDAWRSRPGFLPSDLSGKAGSSGPQAIATCEGPAAGP